MKGESVGYTVGAMDDEFPISNYPLEQTDFLYDSKQGTVDKNISSTAYSMLDITLIYIDQKARDKFEDEKNAHFDYSMFHIRWGS